MSEPEASDCPGRFKCHGPPGWCDVCGDVSLVCDDPDCMVHDRGDELRKKWGDADFDLRRAEREYLDAKKVEREAWHLLERWRTGHPVMVSRERD